MIQSSNYTRQPFFSGRGDEYPQYRWAECFLLPLGAPGIHSQVFSSQRLRMERISLAESGVEGVEQATGLRSQAEVSV